MIRGEIRKVRARSARWPVSGAIRVTLRAAVSAVAGLMVIVAMAPASAAQRPGGLVSGHAHASTAGAVTRARVAAGGGHTCGILADGTLWCWGDNSDGQLGAGNTDQDRPRQVTYPAPGGWVSVTAGEVHTCAVRAGGTLWCWGDNSDGQLGIGNFTGQDRPRQVTSPAPGGWDSVTAGNYHTCAIRTGGTLWCWGWNPYDQLGTGYDGSQDLPQPVTALAPGWVSVTAGYGHTCAIRTGGTLWCWGDADAGQLGHGPGTAQVTIPAPGGWVSVAAGWFHTCAIRAGGTLWCWGNNLEGEVGIGGGSTRQYLPQQVTTPAAAGWTSVTGGGFHTCATRVAGTLWCWGSDRFGAIGIGYHPNQFLPRQVISPVPWGWASVSGGGDHTCAVRAGGDLWCWGANDDGQLGIGNYANQCHPRRVTALPWPAVQMTRRPG
jgi:alpha-tubulin suppressor-like RCC1 family protein